MSKVMQEIKKLKADAEKLMQEKGKDALQEMFSEFFKKNPTVEAVHWSQYTPYFNDGDACNFSVNGFAARIKGLDPEEDHFSWSCDYEYNGWLTPSYNKRDDIGNALCKLETEMDDDVLLAVFGDHVEVTATPEGFEVDEYSHD